MPDKNLTAGASDEVAEEEKKPEPPDLEESGADEGADEETGEQEKSVYEEELARIEAEKASAKAEADAAKEELEKERREKDRLMQLKDKALEKEKLKTQDISERLKSEIHQEWERKQDLRDARSKVSEITSDPTAQKVVMHYFETLPEALRTGSVEDQLLTALALANRKRLPNLLNSESSEDADERRSLSSMGGNDGGGRSTFKTATSAKAQVASRLSKAYAGKDSDLAKRLAEKAQNKLSGR